jgi:hypothetical protein
MILLKKIMGVNRMEKMNPMDEIIKISNELPLEVVKDIDKRIGDWLASGGKEDDPYIFQQLSYAKRIVKMLKSS